MRRKAWTDVFVGVGDEGTFKAVAAGMTALRLCTRPVDRFHLLDPDNAPPELVAAIAEAIAPPAVLTLPDEFEVPAPPVAVTASVPEIDLRTYRRPASRLVRKSKIVRWVMEVAGLPLSPRQQEYLHAISETTARLILACLGRQSGKSSFIAAPFIAYEAIVNATKYTAGRSGRVTFMVLANSREQTGVTGDPMREIFNRPGLAAFVESQTTELIRLKTGIDVWFAPTNARSIRGRNIALAVLDELAYAADNDGSLLSPQAASELLSAIRPAMSTYEHARLIVTSTPRARNGPFWDLFNEAQATGLLFQAPSWEVNPMDSVVRDALAAYRINPALAEREFGARFTDGIGQLLPVELVEAAVRDYVRLMPQFDREYFMVMDPSGAAGGDAFVAIVVHVDDGDLVLDWWQAWTNADMRTIATTLVDVARAYRCESRAWSDQWGFSAVKALLEEKGLHGVRQIKLHTENKAKALGLVRQRLVAGTLALPTGAPKFVSELASLEVTRLASGEERIAAPRSTHDDCAMTVLMAALVADEIRLSSAPIAHSRSPFA